MDVTKIKLSKYAKISLQKYLRINRKSNVYMTCASGIFKKHIFYVENLLTVYCRFLVFLRFFDEEELW